MFESTVDSLNDARLHKHILTQNGEPLNYADVLHLWQEDNLFRSFFISLLSECPFAAYRWETPAITHATLHQHFEFILLNSPWLVTTPDPAPFVNYFTTDNTHDGIVVFANLGKDATLVVPSPRGPGTTYGHLAAFMRTAPDAQKHSLWRIVGQTVVAQIRDRPLWLSTAGGGVSWLHVRLDSRPKYYGFQAYTSPS